MADETEKKIDGIIFDKYEGGWYGHMFHVPIFLTEDDYTSIKKILLTSNKRYGGEKKTPKQMLKILLDMAVEGYVSDEPIDEEFEGVE